MINSKLDDVKTLNEFAESIRKQQEEAHGEHYCAMHDTINKLAKDCKSYKELGVHQGGTLANALLQPTIKYVEGIDISLEKYNAYLKPIAESYAKENKKALQAALDELMLITGQKPVITKAKKDVSNFKVRKGFPVGCKVTLRKDYMYEFLERLCAVALPRTRDFRGLSPNSFDGRGNFNMGIKEQIIFPEIQYDEIDKTLGIGISFVTSTESNEKRNFLLNNIFSSV